jgi:hypothetical protein
MKDLNSRIQQLTKLILTSQTVDETKGDDSRPSSPVKIDFDMSPYQVNVFLTINQSYSWRSSSLAPTGTPCGQTPTRDPVNPDSLS